MPLRNNHGTPIPPQPPAAAAAPAPGGRTLPVPYLAQEQGNWCWAGCCEMVFHHAGKNIGLTQCQMASDEFGVACCTTPNSAVCNQGNWPHYVYNRYAFGYTQVNRALSFADVQAEIDANRPVEIYYAWTGGGAHVALIIGYLDNGDVVVHDPWGPWAYTSRQFAFSYVLSAYSLGNWTMTYKNLR